MIPMPNEQTLPWCDAEPLECVMVIPEAPDVKTFSFRPPSGARFSYKAGQFVTLDLPVPGGNIQRTYTISSSPVSSSYITVTVKAQPGSVGTRWMLDHLQPGMRLKAYGPNGLFHLQDQGDGKYLFISAGSGVTPMMSMTTTLYERGEDPDICFIQCARRPVDLIFRRRLENMASRVTGLQLHFVVEQSDPYDVWTGYRGILNQVMLGAMCADYLDREVYCCGPEPFMNAVRDILHSLGHNMEHYYQESFAAPANDPAALTEFSDHVPSETESAEVSFTATGLSGACAETDTVLTVARATGLPIPVGCGMGLCGTCKVLKTSGEVHMVHNGGITDDEIEEGYILACCSHPIGRVEIDA